MKRNFRRDVGVLDEVFQFVDDFAAAHEIEDRVIYKTKLAAEELFTNMVRHNKGGRNHIVISLEREEEKLVLQLEDFDVEPFDITKADPVDIGRPLEERKVGGLGLHLVKCMMNELTCAYRGGTVCIRAIQDLRRKDV